MDPKDFERLKESVRQMVAVKQGKAVPSRTLIYKGKILVGIKEHGETVWTLVDAANQMKEELDGVSFDSYADNIKAARKALNQTQEGFSQLLDIPLGTLRGWEQGRRSPIGAAHLLLRVVILHPDAVFDVLNQELELEC